MCLISLGALSADEGGSPTLDETRLALGKWIETQQIISRERAEWHQSRDILEGRLELVNQEIATLEEKIAQAESDVEAAEEKRREVVSENQALEAAGAQLTDIVTRMEGDVRQLDAMVPEPVRTRIQPLFQRMPDVPADTSISAAERFQNVLGILNELNKANNEITVNYEVHDLAGGKPSEVQAIYVGLAQAYYVSARGEAGIGRPGDDGWKWEPSGAVAGDVLTALEIKQGKHTPAFVPLPVTLK